MTRTKLFKLFAETEVSDRTPSVSAASAAQPPEGGSCPGVVAPGGRSPGRRRKRVLRGWSRCGQGTVLIVCSEGKGVVPFGKLSGGCTATRGSPATICVTMWCSPGIPWCRHWINHGKCHETDKIQNPMVHPPTHQHHSLGWRPENAPFD